MNLTHDFYKLPLIYDNYGALVWDSDSHRAMDIRGFGALNQVYLSENECAVVQDEFGKFVVSAVNHHNELLTIIQELVHGYDNEGDTSGKDFYTTIEPTIQKAKRALGKLT